MKKLVLLSIFLGMALTMTAIPARPGKFPFTQPDGSTILIEQHGDEFYHWVTAADGSLLEMDTDGFYRPATSTPAAREAARKAGESRRAQAYNEQQLIRANAAPQGRKHYLVVLIQFSDLSFRSSDPQQAFSNLLNEVGYSTNGATGSARDYYYDNSDGAFEPVFDVVGPVTLSKEYSYYGANRGDVGGNDMHADEALYEACQLLDDTVDFSDYDLDGDGYVDLVFYYFAGTNEAEGGGADRIWPHKYALYSYSARFDGVRVYDYACTSELNGYNQMCGIGTACHEFGHALGLPDLYDTNYATNGEAGALYSYSLMDGGGYNNMGRTPPYLGMQERIMLGWKTEDDITEITEAGTYTIPAINGASQQAYKLGTSVSGEYFMLECRQKTGWDAALPGEGLLIYHVDKSSNRVGYYTASRLWDWTHTGNIINAYGDHPCCYLIPAGDVTSLNYGSESLIPFPTRRPAVDSYTPVDWAGLETPCRLEDISYAAGTATLTAFFPPDDITQYGYHFIDNPGNGSYTAGSTFTFKLNQAESNPPSTVSWYFDGTRRTSSGIKLTAGTHTVEARLTYADGATESVYLTLTAN